MIDINLQHNRINQLDTEIGILRDSEAKAIAADDMLPFNHPVILMSKNGKKN